MLTVSPRKPKAVVPVLCHVDLICWIIEIRWHEKGEVGTRCTLCGDLLTNAPWSQIRYLPDNDQPGQSMSERTLRACAGCSQNYSDCPFPAAAAAL